MNASWEQEFRAALAQANQAMAGGDRIIVDDRVHRYRAQDDKEADAWYALHSVPGKENGDMLIVGAFGHWGRQPPVSWCSKQKNQISREEWGEISRAQKDIAVRRAEEERVAQEKTRAKVSSYFTRFPKADFHLYHAAKGIEQPIGDVRIFEDELYNGWLCLPLQDIAGTIHSAQFIDDDGQKKFAAGGRVKGCFFLASNLALDQTGGPIIICEGYATGTSIAQATGWPVVCAMNCGNLLAVAKDIRASFPTRTIVVAGDNDAFTDGNPGATKARESAKSVNALLALPEFADSVEMEKPTDFNDLAQSSGLNEVRRQIFGAFPILKVLESRRYDPDARPPEIRPIYTCQGKVICTPANITTITSGIKTGKTAVIGAMVSSAMTNGTENIDNLTFASQNPDQKAIIHFDSEQSPDDHWFAIDRILRRAQMNRAPDWFYSYCLTGLGAKTAWECVQQAHLIAAQAHGGLHSVFTDGAADLVSDVNDPEECNDRVAQLHELAITYQCPHATVIHFNPGSEKSRGHLGSQLERKAETNLILEKNKDEVTRIYSVKNRRAGIPKSEGPCFRYDEESRLHITCESSEASGPGGRPNNSMRIASSNLAAFLAQCPSYGEGKNEIARRLREWLATNGPEDVGLSSCKKVITLCVANEKLSLRNERYFRGPNA